MGWGEDFFTGMVQMLIGSLGEIAMYVSRIGDLLLKCSTMNVVGVGGGGGQVGIYTSGGGGGGTAQVFVPNPQLSMETLRSFGDGQMDGIGKDIRIGQMTSQEPFLGMKRREAEYGGGGGGAYTMSVPERKRLRFNWTEEEDEIFIRAVKENPKLSERELLGLLVEKLGTKRSFLQCKNHLKNLIRNGKAQRNEDQQTYDQH